MLRTTVRWGEEKGIVLRPHKFRNGKFKASKCKSGPHRWATTEADLEGHVDQGWPIRMSNPDSDNHRAPSLIVPRFIERR